MTLQWVDYAIIGIILLSVITGLFRGFIKELLSLVVWCLAIWMAFHYSSSLDPWLMHYIQDKTARTAVAFIGIIIVTIIIGGIFNTLLSFILKKSGLSGTDRILGMGFGLLRGVFLVALVILILKMTGFSNQDYLDKSRLYAKFTPIVDWLSGYTPQIIAKASKLNINNIDMEFDTDDVNPSI